MSTPKAEILLHPIRLRIVLAMGTEALTTAELADRLPDVAQATLYRQIARLAEAGILEIVDERRVRGGTERTYALVAEAAGIGPHDVASMSSEEHMRGFVTFVGSLVEALGRYLADPQASPSRDPFGYRQTALWVDDGEQDRFVEELRTVVARYAEHGPKSERQRVLFSTILIPDPSADKVASAQKDRRDSE